MKIGIYGGSFNPVHAGHVMIAGYLSQFCGLDELWVMVSPRNPLKGPAPEASPLQRLEMCRIAMTGLPGVKVSDFEFSLPVPSYTYSTLSALERKYPENEFVLCIGGDSLASLGRWKNSLALISGFSVIVYPRPGIRLAIPAEFDGKGKGITLLEDVPSAEISSTFIRNGCRCGKNMNPFLPHGVFRYIMENNLYGRN